MSLNSLVLRCDGTVTEIGLVSSQGAACVRMVWDGHEHEGRGSLVLPKNIRPITPPRVA